MGVQDFVLQMLNFANMTVGTDVHFAVGAPPAIRINGEIVFQGNEPLIAEVVREIAHFLLGDKKLTELNKENQIVHAGTYKDVGRFRITAFKQKGVISIVARRLGLEMPDCIALGVPAKIINLTKAESGIVIIAGPPSSGKSTTAAAFINEINTTRSEHITTVENPIEFVHTSQKSIITQREIGEDATNETQAFANIFKQDIGVLYLAELKDALGVEMCLSAAENGALVLTTISATSAQVVAEQIINAFEDREDGKMRLETVLKGIILLKAKPRRDGQTGLQVKFELITKIDGNAILKNIAKPANIAEIAKEKNKEVQ